MSNLQPLIFLVLSDIHFGKFADSSEFSVGSRDRDTVTSHCKPICENLVNKVLQQDERPQALLVPGDLTSIASPSEFRGCVEAVLYIADKLSIPRELIYVTYGNHDVDWRVCDLATETQSSSADPGYIDLAAMVGSLFCPTEEYTEAGPLPGCGIHQTEKFILFSANTGYFSNSTQSIRHGKLGEEQLEWLRTAVLRYDCPLRWKILMLHHHPFNYTYPKPVADVSCIEEGAELVELAGLSGIDIICHGHRHHPRLFTELRTGWRRPVTFFCAGSVGVDAKHRDSGRIPNLFHIVSLKHRLDSGGAFGTVTSFEFASDGWRAIRDSPETPLDHIHWFGALSTDPSRSEAITDFLQQAIDTAEQKPQILLPPHEMLPPEMKCCCLAELNKLLISQAPSKGFRMVGKYPDDVALMRQ